MERQGLVARELYSKRPPRALYALTERRRGLGLVVGALAMWGRPFVGPRSGPRHAACGHPIGCSSTARAVKSGSPPARCTSQPPPRPPPDAETEDALQLGEVPKPDSPSPDFFDEVVILVRILARALLEAMKARRI